MTGVPRYKRIDVFAFQGPQDYRIAETHAPLNSGETFRGQTRPEGLIVNSRKIGEEDHHILGLEILMENPVGLCHLPGGRDNAAKFEKIKDRDSFRHASDIGKEFLRGLITRVFVENMVDSKDIGIDGDHGYNYRRT
jgi:hypothetical protein